MCLCLYLCACVSVYVCVCVFVYKRAAVYAFVRACTCGVCVCMVCVSVFVCELYQCVWQGRERERISSEAALIGMHTNPQGRNIPVFLGPSFLCWYSERYMADVLSGLLSKHRSVFSLRQTDRQTETDRATE